MPACMTDLSATMTIVVPTFRRREAVVRLLRAFADELEDAEAGAGVDVLVVVDGSEDGTVEAVEALPYPVPLRTSARPNAGLATARNRGLAEAGGEVVWFVDDDMVPTNGLIRRHRTAHAELLRQVIMGPCLHPPEAEIAGPIRDYAERWFGELARAGAVTRPFDFSAANTSAPRETWREVGGFEEGLRGWGGEDYEIGHRLLRAGVPIIYDAEAVAWHLQARSIQEFLANRRDQGRNFVRIARLHPDTVDDLMPASSSGRGLRTIHRISRGRPAGYAAAGRLLALAATSEAWLTRGARTRFLTLADEANQLAGVAELDTEGAFVERYFDET
jgi:GT2 family glycosyltransferase